VKSYKLKVVVVTDRLLQLAISANSLSVFSIHGLPACQRRLVSKRACGTKLLHEVPRFPQLDFKLITASPPNLPGSGRADHYLAQMVGHHTFALLEKNQATHQLGRFLGQQRLPLRLGITIRVPRQLA